jgi:hypothetical protein
MADVFLAIVFALFNRSEDRSQAARWFASKQHFWEIHRNPIIDVLFPLVGWLIEGFEHTPLSTGLFDDRWYTSSLSLYFDHFRTWLKVIYGICSISYMGWHPSHWRTHIFRGVGQPPTRWQQWKLNGPYSPTPSKLLDYAGATSFLEYRSYSIMTYAILVVGLEPWNFMIFHSLGSS